MHVSTLKVVLLTLKTSAAEFERVTYVAINWTDKCATSLCWVLSVYTAGHGLLLPDNVHPWDSSAVSSSDSWFLFVFRRARRELVKNETLLFKLHSDAAADCYELYLHAPDCTYISPFLLACVPTCAMLIEMLPCLK